MKREVIRGPGTPAPIAHYCEGVLAGDTLYAAGQVWKEYFPSPPPRTTVQVSALLVPGCRIEIDLPAVLP